MMGTVFKSLMADKSFATLGVEKMGVPSDIPKRMAAIG